MASVASSPAVVRRVLDHLGQARHSALPSTTGVGVFCPQCAYDLRGIPENRCPECGFGYDHAAIRALARSEGAQELDGVLRVLRISVIAASFSVVTVLSICVQDIAAGILLVGFVLGLGAYLRLRLTECTTGSFWTSIDWLGAFAAALFAAMPVMLVMVALLFVYTPFSRILATVLTLATLATCFRAERLGYTHSELTLPDSSRRILKRYRAYSAVAIVTASILTLASWL